MKASELYICPCGTYVYSRPDPPTECQWPTFPANLCAHCLTDWRLAKLEYEVARTKDFGPLA